MVSGLKTICHTGHSAFKFRAVLNWGTCNKLPPVPMVYSTEIWRASCDPHFHEGTPERFTAGCIVVLSCLYIHVLIFEMLTSAILRIWLKVSMTVSCLNDERE